MNKILSRIAIAIASFAMVIGGVAITNAYSKEQAKPAHAVAEESITIEDIGRYLYIDDVETQITATPHNFTPTEYTWTSSNTSVVTVSGTGATATVNIISKGNTNIRVSAQGTNGTVTSNSYFIQVVQFDISPYYSGDVEMQPCSSVSIPIYFWPTTMDYVYEVTSSNSEVATGKIIQISDYGDYMLIINSGYINDASAVITMTAKDRNGGTGCHTSTKTLTVRVRGYNLLGEKVVTAPEYGEEIPVLLANNDKTKFVHIEHDHSWDHYSYPILRTTTDIREASLFTFDTYCRLKAKYFCISIEGVQDGLIGYDHGNLGIMSVDEAMQFDGFFYGYYNPSSYNSDPGMLAPPPSLGPDYLEKVLGIKDNGDIDLCDLFYDDFEPIFAYSAIATNPSIVPDDTSINLAQGNSVDIDAEVTLVNRIDYEIISGASSIEQVTVSEINQNHATIHIETSDTLGTAVIRVKDHDNNNIYTDITVIVKIDAETVVGNLLTQTQLSYHYEGNSVDGFVFSNISIRFGAKINKDVWNQIDNDYGIDGFGVMITAYGGDSFSITSRPDLVSQDESAIYDLDNWIVDYYMPTSGENSMATPPEVGDDYVYNLFHRVDENNERYRVFTAAAYIKLSNGNYLFMQQVRYSVSSLAADYLANRGCDDTTAGGSLAYLAGPQA